MSKIEKYRISISMEEMHLVLQWPDCPPALAKRIRLALVKANDQLLTPAFTSAVKEKTLDDYYREACKRVKENLPLDAELQTKYDEYRYSNDLMSPDEETNYEATYLL